MSTTPLATKADEPAVLADFALEDVKLEDSESAMIQDHVQNIPLAVVSETMSRDTPPLIPPAIDEKKALQSNDVDNNNTQRKGEPSENKSQASEDNCDACMAACGSQCDLCYCCQIVVHCISHPFDFSGCYNSCANGCQTCVESTSKAGESLCNICADDPCICCNLLCEFGCKCCCGG